MRTEAYIFIAVTSLGGVTTTHSWSRIQTLAVLTLLDNDTFRGMIFNSYLCYFFFYLFIFFINLNIAITT